MVWAGAGGSVSAMDYRRLGRTEHHSSVAIFGGAALWQGGAPQAEAAFGAALDAGVNHLDVAPQYGAAQDVLGPLVGPVRDQLFVACKTLRRNPDGVRAQMEDSLQRLHCDTFDLYQVHAVTDLDELDARADAFEVIMAAREEGLCRWVGVTGHEHSAPAAHLEALRRYDLDTVMFPVNPRLWSDPDYRRDAEALLDEAASRDVGVMAIKAAAARPWGDRERTATTWYEPYVSADEVARGVGFVLSTPGVHAFCTPGDTEVLPLALAAARTVSPWSTGQRAAAMAEVAGEASIFPMPRT